MSVISEVTHFRIRKNEGKVELSQVAEPDCNWPDFQDLKVSVPWGEVRGLASYIECAKTKEAIYPLKLEGYHRLLVYCAARPGIGKENQFDLARIVLGLNGYDLSYWALQFKRAFWSDLEDRTTSLPRVATSFALLFGLV